MRRALLLFGPLLIGCASTTGLRVRSEPPAAPFELLAVAPIELRYEGEPLEPELRTEDVLAGLWRRTTWPVLTSREFTVIDPRLSDPLRQTDVVIRLKPLKVAPQRLLMLKTVIALREASNHATMSSPRGHEGGVDYQGEVSVSMALLDPGGKALVDLEVTRPIDPFREHPDSDARPEVREALGVALDSLVEACPRCVREGPRFAIETSPTPAVLLALSGSEHVISTASGEAERELLVLRVVQYLRPAAAAEIAGLSKLPPGFCVLDLAPPPPFAPGDCVVGIGSEPVTSPHALRRIRTLRGSDLPLELSVIGRGGARRTIQAP